MLPVKFCDISVRFKNVVRKTHVALHTEPAQVQKKKTFIFNVPLGIRTCNDRAGGGGIRRDVIDFFRDRDRFDDAAAAVRVYFVAPTVVILSTICYYCFFSVFLRPSRISRVFFLNNLRISVFFVVQTSSKKTTTMTTAPAKLYGKNLSEYDDLDVDQLLSQLSPEEISILAKEVDPDVSAIIR